MFKNNEDLQTGERGKKLKLHSNRPSVMPMENQKELKKISLTGSILNLNTYNLRLLILEKKE